MKKTIVTMAMAAALMLTASGLNQARAQEISPNCKVAFVNLARVLEESQEGKKLKGQLDAERDRLMGPIKTKSKQLEDLESKITALTQEIIQKSTAWDDNTKLIKQNELQNLQLQYNQLLNSVRLEKDTIQQQFLDKKNEMLKPLEDKLNKIMEDIGKAGGYCIVFDVSPPSANMPSFNPIIYRDPARDITDQVIKAVDGK